MLKDTNSQGEDRQSQEKIVNVIHKHHTFEVTKDHHLKELYKKRNSSAFQQRKTSLFQNEDKIKYKAYTKANFKKLQQIADNFTASEIFEMEVVAEVLPFKTNNYIVEELIDWSDPKKDPMFILNFPQRQMLIDEHFNKMASALMNGDKDLIAKTSFQIRKELNPNPAGQSNSNIPKFEDYDLSGVQHKYDQTLLFFPSQGQTCHAYCTFCFRWSQFVDTDSVKFAQKEIEPVIEYIRANPTVTDILFTGGDPMVMSPKVFEAYINKILDAKLPNLQNIRIGTKSLAYWPYTYLTNRDSDKLLASFKKIVDSGMHLSIMGHFNHFVELLTPALRSAVEKILETGANIRTQSPIFKNINDHSRIWEIMWREQVKLGMIPYYMFIARDTGAKQYFDLSLVEAHEIFKNAYKNVSGLARTVRGPSMSCSPGKIQILGVTEVYGEKVIALRFLQGRNKDWVHIPFFAKYDPTAKWIDDLKPAFGEEKFFFQK